MIPGYVLAAAVVLAINLLPAFGPPTWAVLVLFKLHLDLAAVPLIVIGAVSAAAGRFALASVSRRLGLRYFVKHQAALAAMRSRIVTHRGASLAGLGLFALSPVPSGQLFVAAGLLNLPLLALTASFFAGRIVSYAGYVTASTLAHRSYGDVATSALRSPWSIAAQVVLLVALTAFPVVLSRRSRRSDARKSSPAAR
jgi:hypothetical protein